jgi:hypothetical protein
MKPLQNIDRWIGKTLERFSAQIAGGPQPKEALEIRREILSEIRDKIEPIGDGAYLFPYQQLFVHINARDAAQLETFEAAFLDDGGLESQVKELLVEAGCKGEVSLTADVKESEGEPYVIEYRRAPKQAEGAPSLAKRPAAWIHVLKGLSDKKEFYFSKNTVYLGRL